MVIIMKRSIFVKKKEHCIAKGIAVNEVDSNAGKASRCMDLKQFLWEHSKNENKENNKKSR